MSAADFGLKEGDAGDRKRFKVFVTSQGKIIHKAELFQIKKGWFGSEKQVFISDLMLPTRKVEDEIVAAKLKLQQLEAKRESTEQEAINLICTFERIFDGSTLVSKLKSKLKSKDEKPKTEARTVALVQNRKPTPNPQQQGKQKNANGQH